MQAQNRGEREHADAGGSFKPWGGGGGGGGRTWYGPVGPREWSDTAMGRASGVEVATTKSWAQNRRRQSFSAAL